MLSVGCASQVSRSAPSATASTAPTAPQRGVTHAQSATLEQSAAPTLVAVADPVVVKDAPSEAAPRVAAATRPSVAKSKRGKAAHAMPQGEPGFDAASIADAEAMIRLARSEVDNSLR